MKPKQELTAVVKTRGGGDFYVEIPVVVLAALGLGRNSRVNLTIQAADVPQEQDAPEPPDEIMVMVQAKTNCVPDRASEQASALARKLGVGVVLLFSPEATVLARCNPDS